MLKTGILAIAAACATMILSSIPTSNAIEGQLNGKIMPNGAGRQYLNDPIMLKAHGLTRAVDWSTATLQISFGYTQWNGINAFIKCVHSAIRTTTETKTFDILIKLKDLPRYNIPGKNNVMQPLKRFDIPDTKFPKNIKNNCFIYTSAPGEALDKLIVGKDWQYKAAYLPQVFYQAMQGMLYLRHAGIIHTDMAAKNIVVHVDPKTRKVQTTVVDYDSLEFAYESVEKTLQLAPVTTLDRLNSFSHTHRCNDANDQFSTAIYHAITGAFLDGDLVGSDDIPRNTLYDNLNAVLNNQPTKPGDLYTDEMGRVPQYPAKTNRLASKALLPLAQAMLKLSTYTSTGCVIPNNILTLLDPSIRKKLIG
ncbi:hypothetical protein BDF19DRAFT_436992 [Syncephalis fuscata]|nr:hypothetical protein BDF19DRAFT_436992 [Syncephalis fuscata]